jgi:1,4-dihydroxy-2-naphthoyl-CoA hydrolase
VTAQSRYWFRVALHDTDAAGVLFFAHLFRHLHDAYEALMANIDFPVDRMIREGALGLPLVHAEADFRRPLRHGNEVHVQMSVSELDRMQFTVGYRIWHGDQEVATALTVHAAIDPVTRRRMPLPDSLRGALETLSAP